MKPIGPPGASASSVSIAFRSAPAQNACVAGAGEHQHARVVVGAEALERLPAARPRSAPSTALRRSGRSIVTSAALPRRS